MESNVVKETREASKDICKRLSDNKDTLVLIDKSDNSYIKLDDAALNMLAAYYRNKIIIDI